LPNVTDYAIYYFPLAYALDLGSGSYHSHFLDRTSTHPLLLVDPLAKITTQRQQRLDDGEERLRTIPAIFVRFESQSSFDERSPMEYSASDAEVHSLLLSRQKNSSFPYLVWVSLIQNTTIQSVRMKSDLPIELVRSGPNDTVVVPVGGGERGDDVRVIQIVLFAAQAPIKGVVIDFLGGGDNTRNNDGITLTCLQTSPGINYRGEKMVPPRVELGVGEVGQLLILVDTKETAKRMFVGNATRLVKIQPTGLPATTITIHFDQDKRLKQSSSSSSWRKKGQDQRKAAGPPDSSDLWRLSRLAWLNAKTGLDEARVTKPYTPVRAETSIDGKGWVLQCLGRIIVISTETGLPARIQSNNRDVLSSPVAFRVMTASPGTRGVQRLHSAEVVAPRFWMAPGNTSAAWSVTLRSSDGSIETVVDGSLGYDGHLDLAVAVSLVPSSTNEVVRLDNISLAIGVHDDIARFAVGGGFGDDGDFFPKNCTALDWSWRRFNHDTLAPSGWRLWVGDVDAGVFLKLKGAEDAWNEANPGGASIPSSWAGGSGMNGGIRISRSEQRQPGPLQSRQVQIEAFSGPVELRRDAPPLLFNFSLVVTPTKGDYVHSDEVSSLLNTCRLVRSCGCIDIHLSNVLFLLQPGQTGTL
jgi:hypothetical protein